MKKILIDLMKCRECKECQALCEFYFNKNKDVGNRGIRNLIELALFSITCRRCEDAPCINVCPEEALEKDKDGMVQRNNNLCVGCKSCAMACPFGTIPNYIVDYIISKHNFRNVDKESELQELIKKCPDKAVQITEEGPSEEKHIYRVTDKVLVKDYKWEEFIK